MGAKSSKKAITKKSSRAAGSTAKKKAPARSTKSAGKKAEKYEESGAPWWKRYLPG